MNALDKKLQETEYIRTNWVRLVSILKHQFNLWATARLIHGGYDDFKMVYMPVIMNIRPEGTINNELASRCRVTKQAMSKVARELIKKGYVKAKTDSQDRRSTLLMLTDRGKRLVIETRECVNALDMEYRQLISPKELERATAVLHTLIEYNDNTLLKLK